MRLNSSSEKNGLFRLGFVFARFDFVMFLKSTSTFSPSIYPMKLVRIKLSIYLNCPDPFTYDSPPRNSDYVRNVSNAYRAFKTFIKILCEKFSMHAKFNNKRYECPLPMTFFKV